MGIFERSGIHAGATTIGRVLGSSFGGVGWISMVAVLREVLLVLGWNNGYAR